MDTRLFSIASGIVLLVGVLGAHNKPSGKEYPAIGYTIHFQEYEIRDGNKRLTRSTVRFGSSDGRWKEVNTLFDEDGASSVQTTGGDSRGALQVSKSELLVTGPSAVSSGWNGASYHSPAYLQSSRQFVRESSLMGYKTYVWRTPGKTDEEYFEFEFSPIIGAVPIRSVEVSPGDKVIQEAVRIELEEPSSEALALPNIPVNYRAVEEKIKRAEENGDEKRSATLKKLINKK